MLWERISSTEAVFRFQMGLEDGKSEARKQVRIAQNCDLPESLRHES